jgi:hypothetical protein
MIMGKPKRDNVMHGQGSSERLTAFDICPSTTGTAKTVPLSYLAGYIKPAIVIMIILATTTPARILGADAFFTRLRECLTYGFATLVVILPLGCYGVASPPRLYVKSFQCAHHRPKVDSKSGGNLAIGHALKDIPAQNGSLKRFAYALRHTICVSVPFVRLCAFLAAASEKHTDVLWLDAPGLSADRTDDSDGAVLAYSGAKPRRGLFRVALCGERLSASLAYDVVPRHRKILLTKDADKFIGGGRSVVSTGFSEWLAKPFLSPLPFYHGYKAVQP